MCFSAEASFAGGAIIAAIGVVTVTKVHKHSQLLFACIPLFFGLQQVTEGILWLTIPNPGHGGLLKFCTYLYLLMADILWPLIIPLSVLFMEENKNRKKYIKYLLMGGIALSVYYSFCLLTFSVHPVIEGYHIRYDSNFPESMAMIAFAVYLIVTLTPLFISSIKRIHIMGILMFFSCVITALFFTQFLTSVWCFFAALISAVIFWILRDSKRKFNLDKLKSLKDEFISPLIEKIVKP
jgi:hypothetical protein